MDFKTATNRLCNDISHSDLANALGVSVATIRQARLASKAKAHRAPPRDWHGVIAALAKKRAEELNELANAVRLPSSAND